MIESCGMLPHGRFLVAVHLDAVVVELAIALQGVAALLVLNTRRARPSIAGRLSCGPDG